MEVYAMIRTRVTLYFTILAAFAGVLFADSGKSLSTLEAELRSAGFEGKYVYYTRIQKRLSRIGIENVMHHMVSSVKIYFIEQKSGNDDSAYRTAYSFLSSLGYSSRQIKRIMGTLIKNGRFILVFDGCDCKVPSELKEVFKDF